MAACWRLERSDENPEKGWGKHAVVNADDPQGATVSAIAAAAGARVLRAQGRDLEIIVNGNSANVLQALRARSPESITTEALTLEEIFVSTLQPAGSIA